MNSTSVESSILHFVISRITCYVNETIIYWCEAFITLESLLAIFRSRHLQINTWDLVLLQPYKHPPPLAASLILPIHLLFPNKQKIVYQGCDGVSCDDVGILLPCMKPGSSSLSLV